MRAFYLPSLHPQPTHLPLHRRTPCQWWWFPTSVRCPMPGRPSCGTTCWPTTPRLVPSDSSLHGGPQAPSSSKWANVLFSIECELFHEAPNWNLGSGGRGAKLAVLFHHEARVEHRAVDYAGRETPRSAFYLFALLRSSEKEPGLHLGKFTDQGSLPGPENLYSCWGGVRCRGSLPPSDLSYEAGGRFLLSWWHLPHLPVHIRKWSYRLDIPVYFLNKL